MDSLKRPEVTKQTLSVIIPCYYKHAAKLFSLLRMYENQTRLPDEVVISLSEFQLVSSEVLALLQNELWAFQVTIIASNAKQGPGTNRNIACKYAKGDIFLCQDADDIPHLQRVEIVHYFFTTYRVDHLMHGYKRLVPGDSAIPFKSYTDLGQVQFACIKDFDTVYYARQFHNGNIAITRRVFDLIKWPSIRLGEDTEFNRAVYQHFDNCIAIRAIIFAYREFLSSTAKVDVEERELLVPSMHNEIREKCHRLKLVKL